MNITIREFTIKDYTDIINLWKKSGLPYKPEGRDGYQSIQGELEKGIGIFLVAIHDGKIIGSILGTHDGRKGWINRLAVAPEFQRQGVAKALLTTIEEHLSALDLDIITCLIEDWNTGSIHFFEKMGYQRHNDILYFSKRKNPDV